MPGKLYTLGDMHFSDARDWDIESFEHFLDWFESYPFEEGSELLQLGDLTEKAKNDGRTMNLCTRFAMAAIKAFKKVVIIGGNHCLSLDVEKADERYSSEFLGSIDSDKIKLVYKETELDMLDGALKVLALPFRHTASQLETYYNDELDPHFYSTMYDLICGHLAVYDPKVPYIKGIDLSKFSFKHAAFGHIHNRCGSMAAFYTGSIMPFRKSEERTDLPRCMKVYDQNGTESEVALPIFRKYHINEKPVHEKWSSNVVHVYETAEGDPSKYYIKKPMGVSFITEASEKLKASEKKSEAFFEDDWTLLTKMCAEQGLTLKRKTKSVLKELLNA